MDPQYGSFLQASFLQASFLQASFLQASFFKFSTLESILVTQWDPAGYKDTLHCALVIKKTIKKPNQ
jgi:hypothetical protein